MKKVLTAVAFIALACGGTYALAGGLFGDVVNVFVPGAGTALDDVHRQIKDAVPVYKDVEEGAAKTVNEASVQAGAPILQEAIARSRDDALRQGVRPIPPEIRANLSGYVSDHLLNIARYRVRGGGDLSIQVNAIRYGHAYAVTLDYVIVFKSENDALYNPALWVHELTHVDQYQRWGMRDFSIRYLRNHGAVEQEAYDAQSRYAAWVAQRNITKLPSASPGASTRTAVNRPVEIFRGAGSSSTCGTSVAACTVSGSAPVGTPCWCNTMFGAATGSLVPDGSGSDQSSGMTPAPTPTAAQGNACSTPMGSCGLAMPVAVGNGCICSTPQGNFQGIAQLLAPASACGTPMGACLLGVPLFPGDRCYCPTPMGPVWGTAN